jgi:hypothetical protein
MFNRKQEIDVSTGTILVPSSNLAKNNDGVEYDRDCYLDEPDENGIYQPNVDAVLMLKKQSIITNIKNLATQCRKSIAGNPDHLETAEWSEKRLRAKRVVENSVLQGDIPKLETEALFRGLGETASDLAAKIIFKADRFEHASIVITGMAASAIKKANEAKELRLIENTLASFEIEIELELAKL